MKHHPDRDMQVSGRNVDFRYFQQDHICFPDLSIYIFSDPYTECVCVCAVFDLDMRSLTQRVSFFIVSAATEILVICCT